MSLIQNHIESPDGATPARTDRVILGAIPGVANVVGASAGAAVVTAVALPSTADLPAQYAVLVNPGQDATWFVSGKTATGFNVTLTPRLATETLAAGAFDVVIVA